MLHKGTYKNDFKFYLSNRQRASEHRLYNSELTKKKYISAMSIRYLNGKICRIERFCCYEYIYMTKKKSIGKCIV